MPFFKRRTGLTRMAVSIQISLSITKVGAFLHVVVCLAILTSIIYYLLDVDNQVVSICFVFNVSTYYFFQRKDDKESVWGCIRRRFKELYCVVTALLGCLLDILFYISYLVRKTVKEEAKKYIARYHNNLAKDINLKKLREKGFKKDDVHQQADGEDEEQPRGSAAEIPGLVGSTGSSSSPYVEQKKILNLNYIFL